MGRNVTALLPKVGVQHEYLMLIPEGLGYEEHHGNDRVQVLQIPRKGWMSRILFDLIHLRRIVESYGADMVLALGNLGLSNCPCKQAILIHQPQLVYPDKHYGKPILKDRLRLWAVKRRVKKCLESTDIVFCQTPVMQKRFSETMGFSIDKIKRMPNAVSEFSKQISVPPVPKVLEDNRQMFNMFFLAKYMPHKNMEVLIDLFSSYHNELKDVRCIITIMKEQNKKAAILLDKIEKYGLAKQIFNVGRLRQEELAGYFCHSNAFFFPTLLESFSGTYLEAMHFGLPILTSDLDFARYVCDDAALYFDPWDPADIVNKIIQLKSSPSLQSALKENGAKRISAFFKSWEEIVGDVLRSLEMLAE